MAVDPTRIVIAGVILVALAGCAASGRSGDAYVVRGGDTLFSIAWRHELTVATLARANGLHPPYTIHPGQRLRLAGGKVRRGVRPKPVPAKAKAKAKAPRRAPAVPAEPPPRWRWPTREPLVKAFGAGNKGMDFRLSVGRRVVAAAAGEVVYAGSGLGGFKHLVIIKHGQRYLSAYSLNVVGRVREGQRVKAGAILAEISLVGRQAQRLHFEIRRDGEAIDPRGVIH